MTAHDDWKRELKRLDRAIAGLRRERERLERSMRRLKATITQPPPAAPETPAAPPTPAARVTPAAPVTPAARVRSARGKRVAGAATPRTTESAPVPADDATFSHGSIVLDGTAIAQALRAALAAPPPIAEEQLAAHVTVGDEQPAAHVTVVDEQPAADVTHRGAAAHHGAAASRAGGDRIVAAGTPEPGTPDRHRAEPDAEQRRLEEVTREVASLTQRRTELIDRLWGQAEQASTKPPGAEPVRQSAWYVFRR